jgi:hypothetical protein
VEPTAAQRENRFAGLFGKVHPGMREQDVVLLIGVPEKRRVATLPATKFFGPRTALEGKWPTETPFDEWEYHRDGAVFLVWFSTPASGSNTLCRVLGRTSYPRDAVF